jgi:hypothetical protein
MNFEIEGQLIVKDNEQQISASFKKREFVIEVENERNPDWNDFIKFQLTQDKCSLIDQYNIGDKLKVSFNIRGRKWEKNGQINYFSNLEAWRIEGVTVQNSPVSADVPPPDLDNIPPENDDLPF